MVEPKKEERVQESASVFVSEYIAPWALPKEEIPIHLVWTHENKYDQIQILLSSNLTIKEFYNVQDFVRGGSETTIKKLYSSNFFGFAICSNRTTEKIHEKKQITVNFLANGKTVQSRSFIANIYRPELSIIERPTHIVLTDDSDLGELLKISMKISGFGSVEIATEVSFGGKFEPNIEPLFQEMARRVATMAREALPTPIGEASAKQKSIKSIKVNPLYIKRLTRTFIDQIKNGQFTLIDQHDVEDFTKWTEKKENRETMQRVLAEHLENILIESILYYFNKYPTEGVALYGGNPSVILKNAVQEMVIKFKYRDAMLNEYKPILVEIPVEDLRYDKNKELKIPINMKWVHEQINPSENGVKC